MQTPLVFTSSRSNTHRLLAVILIREQYALYPAILIIPHRLRLFEDCILLLDILLSHPVLH